MDFKVSKIKTVSLTRTRHSPGVDTKTWKRLGFFTSRAGVINAAKKYGSRYQGEVTEREFLINKQKAIFYSGSTYELYTSSRRIPSSEDIRIW